VLPATIDFDDIVFCKDEAGQDVLLGEGGFGQVGAWQHC
jgi:hypothetical protein